MWFFLYITIAKNAIYIAWLGVELIQSEEEIVLITYKLRYFARSLQTNLINKFGLPATRKKEEKSALTWSQSDKLR